MMARGTLSADDGQALVIVALAIVVLLGALGVVVDWGYAVTQRRVSQNEADGATLAVGRLLATSVGVNGGFVVSQDEAWCTARQFRDRNRRLDPTTTESITVSFSTTGRSWTTPLSSANCPTNGSGDAVPSGTLYARVVVTTSYRAFFGAATGRSQIATSASARVKLSGAPVSENAPVLPFVRRFSARFATSSAPCGAFCNPNDVGPMLLWRPGINGIGEFKGLMDLSHSSSRVVQAGDVHQYVSHTDATGTVHSIPLPPETSATRPISNRSTDRTCGGPGAPWDTGGDEDRSTPGNPFGRSCSIPNWFSYGFRGLLRLGTNWSAEPFATYVVGNPTPSALSNTRAACASASYFSKPSCAGATTTLGDWVETAFGDLDANMVARLAEFVQANGRALPHSDDVINVGLNAGGPRRFCKPPLTATDRCFGKGVVVHLFLWDCAEGWTGGTWQLIGTARSCDTAAPAPGQSVDRVHLFSVVPITIYEGLVSTTAVEAYWGNVFGDPNSCRTCALNPLSNTAFLVPDE